MNKLEKLREIAEAATQDQWHYVEQMGVYTEGDIETVHNHGTKSWSNEVAKAAHAFCFKKDSDNAKNMKHIATFDPATVLKLIEVIEVQANALEDVFLNTKPERKANFETRINVIGIDAGEALVKAEKLISEIEVSDET